MDCYILLTQNRVDHQKTRDNIKNVIKIRKKIYSGITRDTKGTYDYTLKKSPIKSDKEYEELKLTKEKYNNSTDNIRSTKSTVKPSQKPNNVGMSLDN